MSEDEGLTKYGVELDEEKTKVAGEGGKPTHCPLCLSELDDGGACPEHGVEPFEPTTGVPVGVREK